MIEDYPLFIFVGLVVFSAIVVVVEMIISAYKIDKKRIDK